MRTSSSGLNGAVHELKRSVIRVVRTATEEVNRRVNDRVATDLACRIWLPDGSGGTAQLIDVSIGGAMLRGVSAPNGSSGRLLVDTLDLPFTVLGADPPDILRVAFDASAVQTAALSSLVARHRTAGVAA